MKPSMVHGGHTTSNTSIWKAFCTPSSTFVGHFLTSAMAEDQRLMVSESEDQTQRKCFKATSLVWGLIASNLLHLGFEIDDFHLVSLLDNH